MNSLIYLWCGSQVFRDLGKLFDAAEEDRYLAGGEEFSMVKVTNSCVILVSFVCASGLTCDCVDF